MAAYGGGSWFLGKKNNIYYQARRQERLSDEGPDDFQDTRGLSSNWLLTAAEQPVSQRREERGRKRRLSHLQG